MERGVDLSQRTKSQQVVKDISYDPTDLLELEKLIVGTRGPLNWPEIRRSWIISELLPGFSRILVFEDDMVKEFRGGVTFCERMAIGCDIQIEVIDDTGDLTCVDVIKSDGISVTHLNLAQRLSCLPENFEAMTGISIQQYYKYDQETIDVIRQHMVTDYVIQNSCDTYEQQVRRYVRVKINEHSVIEKNLLDTPVLVDNMECEVKDVEEQMVISDYSTDNLNREVTLRRIAWFKKLCFVSLDRERFVSKWDIPMYFHYNGGYKIMFYSLKELFFRIGIGTILDDFHGDVMTRVKKKRKEFNSNMIVDDEILKK